jgi:hypothetical protein
MRTLASFWNALVERLSAPRHLIGASLFRVVGGTAILAEYLTVYHQRHYLFGPDAAVPWDKVDPWMSIYAWSADPAFFELTFHLGVVTAVLWLLGIHTRWLTPAQLVFWFSLLQRNPLVPDGGDNLMSLLLFYALFADLDQHFACIRPRPSLRSLLADAAAVAHNVAIIAITVQVCLVYAVAGLTKVQGETWRNGTALYYALRASEFYLPGVSELLWSNASALTLASYVTVFFQISFPYFVVLGARTRVFAAIAGCCFHVAIIGMMGLVTFGLFMIAGDLVLMTDREYRRFGAWLRHRVRFAGTLRQSELG